MPRSIVAIIPSRWNSTRFPGKALADLCGKPVLRHIVDHARGLNGVSEVIVATSHLSQPIIDYCEGNGIRVYVGDEDDVLARLCGAADSSGAEIVLRLWGDNPIDPYAYLVSVEKLKKANREATQEQRNRWNNITEFELFPIIRQFIPNRDWSINTPADLRRAERYLGEASQGS